MTGQEAVENLFKTIYMSEDAMSWLNRSTAFVKKSESEMNIRMRSSMLLRHSQADMHG